MTPSSSDSAATALTQQAADWLARRDRGLSAAEQDEYLHWLRADPHHANALAAHEATLRRMMRLADWQPTQSDEPNPDLFAPPPRRSRGLLYGSLAAAAAVLLAAGTWWSQTAPTDRSASTVAKSYLRVNERQVLPDGSLVELKDGSRNAVDFSPAIRRVRLIGEAHFTVTKDPARPFIVEASGVAVRAVGTAFNVREDTSAVEVVVTEGTVRIDPPATAAPAPSSDQPAVASPLVSAGHRAVIPLAAFATVPQVVATTESEIAATLAWQAPRLQFLETPLAEAVAEFNRHNRQQLTLARPELGEIPIGGTFRVNNVEGFVRLLETTLNVQVVSRTSDSIVLARAR
jgi:transmembrane sensor